MATGFRATVMLLFLVGLPSVWIYYGPLPPAAMGVIERTVASARQSFGLEASSPSSPWSNESKTAPRFESSLAQATQILQEQTSRELVVEAAALPLPVSSPTTLPVTLPTSGQAPLRQDAQFSLASATQPLPQPNLQRQHEPTAAAPVPVDTGLAAQLSPHLSLLRSQGAADYTLEKWGNQGLYRFRCSVALGNSDDHTQQFEAVHADPIQAVHQVVGEVTAHQNARLQTTQTRWR